MEFIMTANGKVTATLLILPLYLNFYLKRNNLLKNLLNNHDFILCLLKSKKEIYIYIYTIQFKIHSERNNFRARINL